MRAGREKKRVEVSSSKQSKKRVKTRWRQEDEGQPGWRGESANQATGLKKKGNGEVDGKVGRWG